MEEQHDLHQDLGGTTGHGQDDVVLDPVSQREVAASCHRKVEQEQN